MLHGSVYPVSIRILILWIHVIEDGCFGQLQCIIVKIVLSASRHCKNCCVEYVANVYVLHTHSTTVSVMSTQTVCDVHTLAQFLQ